MGSEAAHGLETVPLPHLRLAIESACNFRCTYCPPWGENHYEVDSRLDVDAVIAVAERLRAHGINTVKITGGEPTLQVPSLLEIVRRLTPLFEDVILITNGWNLAEIGPSLHSAGLRRIEVSLDAADEDVFAAVVQRPNLYQPVINGLKTACNLGWKVQINAVVMRSLISQVDSILSLATELAPIRVKFIELVYYAFPGPEFFDKEYVAISEIEPDILRRSSTQSMTVPDGDYGSPMRTYHLPSGVDVILKDGTVGSVYSDVCRSCDQFPCQDGLYGLTLTVDRKLKICKHRPDLAVQVGSTPEEQAAAVELVASRYVSRFFQAGWNSDRVRDPDQNVPIEPSNKLLSWYRPGTYGTSFCDRLRTEGTSVMVEIVARPQRDQEVVPSRADVSQDIDAVVLAANRAFLTWRHTPSASRARAIYALAASMRARVDDLATAITESMRKPISQSRGEILSAAEILDYYAAEAERVVGDIPKLDQPGELPIILKQPVGPVLAITPSNFPISLLSWKLGPALAAGCTVVSKPHELTSAPQLLLAEVAKESGLPDGVFQVVTGNGTVGDALVRHPGLPKVAFTGGVEVGSKVASVASGLGKRISMELGGQCPAIVWSDADLDRCVPNLVKHAFNNSGQYCYRINRIYCSAENSHELQERLKAAIGAMRIGHPHAETTEFGPLCGAHLVDRSARHVADAVAKGAVVVSGGMPADTPADLTAEAEFYYPPTLLANCTSDMLVMTEETFGPVLGVQIAADFDEAVRLANGTIYGLAAYVFTSNLSLALRAAMDIDAGSVWVNDVKRAYPQMPFGGFKRSGVGREKSPYGLDEYLELKSIYLSY